MKFLLITGSLLCALLLGGCASGPKFGDVSGSFAPLAADKGRIFIYRAAVMGAAIQPDVKVDGTAVGTAKPKGFFYIDRPAGSYVLSCSTEVKRTLSLVLAPGETRYVRLGISMGFMAGHVYPELVEAAEGQKEIASCSYTGAGKSAFRMVPAVGSAQGN
jgi:hypothetical protein